MGIAIFLKKNPCNKHNNIDKRGHRKRKCSTHNKDTCHWTNKNWSQRQRPAWFSHWTQLLLVLPLLMVLPHWGEKQSHQGARAAPLSLVGLSYSSGQSLQHHAQRNRTGDWQGTGDSVCMFDTDGPSAGASETKWPTSRFRYLTFPAENMMWMVWNNPKTPASLSVPRTLG